MTTAELIKKREEEKNKPLQETKPNFTSMIKQPNPADINMQKIDNTADNMYRAEMTRKGATDPVANRVEEQKVSLYDAGKQVGNIGQVEKTLKGQSPITTPEYEKFRNEVVGAQQFGVETPEQAAARERRDFIKQGLTGFTEGLSALANLYYTTKGAPNQKQVSQMPELSKRLYSERLERDKKLENFRAWQRAKAEKDEDRKWQEAFYDKKQKDAEKSAERKAKYEAAEKAAEREFKIMFEGLQQSNKKEMAELNDKLRKGQISYQEALKLANKIAYDNSSDKVVDSVKGSDGTVLTRSSRLTDNELRQLVTAYVDDLSPWTKIEEDEYHDVKKETVDYRGAFADAVKNGKIPTEVLEQMGFKQLNTEKKGKSLPGVESNNKKGKHLNL